MKKNELAKRLNITTKTLYNWEETKPELIKLIELGLQKKAEIKEDKETINKNVIKEILESINLLKDEVEHLKKISK